MQLNSTVACEGASYNINVQQEGLLWFSCPKLNLMLNTYWIIFHVNRIEPKWTAMELIFHCFPTPLSFLTRVVFMHGSKDAVVEKHLWPCLQLVCHVIRSSFNDIFLPFSNVASISRYGSFPWTILTYGCCRPSEDLSWFYSHVLTICLLLIICLNLNPELPTCMELLTVSWTSPSPYDSVLNSHTPNVIPVHLPTPNPPISVDTVTH